MSTPDPATTPFAWTDEHREFGAFLRKRLESLSPRDRAREALDTGRPAMEPGEWADLCAELGIAGIALPEEFGGSGGGRVEQAIVAEELGHALVGGPYLSTVVLAAEAIALSGDHDAMSALLPSIVEGELLATLAVAEDVAEWELDALTTSAVGTSDVLTVSGRKAGVLGGSDAQLFVVAANDPEGGASLFAVSRDGQAPNAISTQQEQLLDATRPTATVRFDRTTARRLGPAGAAPAILDRVREGAAIFLAAEQAGVSRACVELSAGYARTRVQFGRPIGMFQGVKHRLADMEVRTVQARAATYWAAWQAPGSEEAALGAAVARSWCSEAVLQTAFDNLQLHGGIAITWEHDAHLYLRRAQASAMLLGRPTAERRRLERFLGDPATTGGAA